jgi:hypothetical protein
MLKLSAALAFASFVAVPAVAQDALVGTFNINVASEFDYVSGSYVPLSIPAAQRFDFSIPLSVARLSIMDQQP